MTRVDAARPGARRDRAIDTAILFAALAGIAGLAILCCCAVGG